MKSLLRHHPHQLIEEVLDEDVMDDFWLTADASNLQTF